MKRLVALLAALLCACSASAVHRQAIASNALGIVADTSLRIVGQAYQDQQTIAIQAACGHADPCADPIAALDAVVVLTKQWDPVWAALAALEVAHAAWQAQIERCQGDPEAGTPAIAGDCEVQLSELLASVVEHTTTVRCALRWLHVTDPFPGTVDCGGVQ